MGPAKNMHSMKQAALRITKRLNCEMLGPVVEKLNQKTPGYNSPSEFADDVRLALAECKDRERSRKLLRKFKGLWRNALRHGGKMDEGLADRLKHLRPEDANAVIRHVALNARNVQSGSGVVDIDICQLDTPTFLEMEREVEERLWRHGRAVATDSDSTDVVQ